MVVARKHAVCTARDRQARARWASYRPVDNNTYAMDKAGETVGIAGVPESMLLRGIPLVHRMYSSNLGYTCFRLKDDMMLVE